MPGFYIVDDKTMKSISVKPVQIRKKKVYLNPLRNPISSLHQWNALKAEEDHGKEDIETGSYEPSLEKGSNPLLNPVSDIHEWRDLMVKDSKPLMTDHQQPLLKAHSYQWTALKAEEDNGKKDIETGSYQPFLEKGCNPLLIPVSDIREWRALMAKETKQLMTDHQHLLRQAHSYQWTALKAEEDHSEEDIETGSYQPFLEKGCNPLLIPVSDIHEWRALMAKETKRLMTDHQHLPPQAHSYQWTALKAEEDHSEEDIETGPYQPFLEKGCNPLQNPVSYIHEWRALMVKDSKPLMTDHHQPLPKAHSHNSNPSFEEFDVAVDASLSCWLSSSSSSENIATK